MSISFPSDKSFHPFFGIEYVTFVKYYVIFALSITLWSAGMLGVKEGISIKNYIFYPEKCNTNTSQLAQIHQSKVDIELYMWGLQWLPLSCYVVQWISMNIRLYRTTAKPNPVFLRFYSMVQYTFIGIMVLYWIFLLYYIQNECLKPKPSHKLIIPMLAMLYSVLLYIILRYAKYIEIDLLMESQYRPLTEEEVNRFNNGEDCKLMENHSFVQMVQSQAYNKAEFEIARGDLNLRDATFLGRGEYGLIYKVNWNGSYVALKTVDPEISDVIQFMALLTEAKVMLCMGHHDNVVRLFGLSTDRIKQRDLYLVFELCALGNLQTFLTSERNSFLSMRDGTYTGDCCLTPHDLVRWCMEIAAGMEFLASKKIVHGDLAARNVLLTESKTAKVTDFGLSRRLYNYSVYQRRKNVPLPWRWLAFESLVDMSFSSRSDVWAYGITCWEIFELGALPWSKFESFVPDFIDHLRDGNVLDKCTHCTDETYDVLKSCWNLNRLQRPSFGYLKEYFSRHG